MGNTLKKYWLEDEIMEELADSPVNFESLKEYLKYD